MGGRDTHALPQMRYGHGRARKEKTGSGGLAQALLQFLAQRQLLMLQHKRYVSPVRHRF